MAGAVLQWILVDEVIELVRQRTGHFGRAPRAGAVNEALRALGGKAMHPFAQRGIGKVQRVRDRLEAVPFHDFAHGLGTPEHAGLFRLFQERI
jgi:hypothetical protein